MNVLVVASNRETGQELVDAVRAANFDVTLGSAERPCLSGTHVLVLDSFDGPELPRLVSLLAPEEPRPVILAGIHLDTETFDFGIQAGIDGFYPGGMPRSLVFQLASWERRSAAARELEVAGSRIEQANDVIYTVDFEGNFTSANAAAEKLTGYRRDQLIGMNMTDLLLPESLAITRETMAAKIAGEVESSVFEVRIRRADGVERAVEISSRLLYERGKAVAVQGIARDVSARRNLEREIVFRAEMLDAMPAAAFAVDLAGEVFFWNRAARDLFAISDAEADGPVRLERIMPGDLAAASRESLVAAGGPGSHSNEVELRRADGSLFPAHVSSSPLRDQSGTPIGALAICLDLSEKRAGERALELSEARYRAAAELSVDGLFTLEAIRNAAGAIEDFVFLDMNTAGESLVVHPREAILGARLLELFPPDAAGTFGHFCRVVETGEPWDSELHLDIPQVRARWLHQSVVRLGDGVAVTSRDVTARHEREAELARTRAELRAIFESTPEALILLDADLRLLTANEAANDMARDLSGRAPDRGEYLRPWVRDGDWAYFQDNCRRALAGERVTIAWRQTNLAGAERWLEYSFNPVRDESGEVYAVAMLARDISAARRMERELAEREAALRAVFESMNDSLVLLDPECRWVLGNPLARARALMATGREPSPGTSMEEYVRPEHWEIVHHSHERALTGARPRVEVETANAHGGGSWWEHRFMPVREESSRVVAVAMVTRDITDRKQAERALQEATEHHRTVVENTSDALFVLEVEGDRGTPDFRIGMVNTAFGQLTGLDPAAITGRLVREVLPGAAWEAARYRYLEAIAARETISYEEVVPFGPRPHIQTRMTPIYDGEGRCTRIIGSSRDITEQVRLAAQERASRESADRLALIVRSANDAIIGLDLDRRIASWSPGAERAYGYTAQEAIGRRIDLIYPGDEARREELLARLDRFYAGEQSTNSLTPRRHKSGRMLEMLISAFPLRDSEGVVVGIGSTATDITGQRQAEEALRNKAADLDAVFASTRHQLFLLDEGGHILSANAAAVESTRGIWGVEVAPGMDIRRFAPDVHVFEANLARCLGGESLEFERSIMANGHSLAMEVEFTPVRREDGAIRGVLLGIRDITERKRTTEALMQAQKLESLAILAGGIAHDFNNLLVGILGNAGLALIELPPTSPARPTIESIEIAGMRAAELARQMLAYSGKGRFVIQDVDMSSLVEEMTHLLRVSIGKQVSLQLQLGRELPAVQGDATQLRQVVMNLVVNASDAIGEAEGVISVRTFLVQATSEMLAATYLAPELPPGPYIGLEVADTGAGMDAETMERVFDPFFTTKFTGRGLGLAAALGIMRSHRGAIKVDSTPGEGTTFCLLLPAAGGAPVAGSTVTEGGEWRGSGTVLVVDDEPTVRAVTARALRAFGFDVVEAADGVEGVEAFRAGREHIVCVLLDMTMPRMGGEETFGAISAIDPDAPVVLMSGYTEQEATSRFAGSKLSGFIQKPYELATLRSVLRAAIEGEGRG